MADTFTPLTFGALPLRETSAPAPAAASPVISSFKPMASLAPEAGQAQACAKPTITLQRNPVGVVTSIRVQCGCGRVTELNCVY